MTVAVPKQTAQRCSTGKEGDNDKSLSRIGLTMHCVWDATVRPSVCHTFAKNERINERRNDPFPEIWRRVSEGRKKGRSVVVSLTHSRIKGSFHPAHPTATDAPFSAVCRPGIPRSFSIPLLMAPLGQREGELKRASPYFARRSDEMEAGKMSCDDCPSHDTNGWVHNKLGSTVGTAKN